MVLARAVMIRIMMSQAAHTRLPFHPCPDSGLNSEPWVDLRMKSNDLNVKDCFLRHSERQETYPPFRLTPPCVVNLFITRLQDIYP